MTLEQYVDIAKQNNLVVGYLSSDVVVAATLSNSKTFDLFNFIYDVEEKEITLKAKTLLFFEQDSYLSQKYQLVAYCLTSSGWASITVLRDNVILPVNVSDGYLEVNPSCKELADSILSVAASVALCFVDTIPNEAFKGCYRLRNLIIPNNVTSIGQSAFSACNSLTSVIIPDSITSIGDYTFSHCSSLTSIEIPDSVTSIGNGAFNGCRSLTSVTIGNSVTSIGDSAFYNCSSLTSIDYSGTIKQWNTISKDDSWKNGVPTTCKVTCTDGLINI